VIGSDGGGEVGGRSEATDHVGRERSFSTSMVSGECHVFAGEVGCDVDFARSEVR
jgi:hypothetical protein